MIRHVLIWIEKSSPRTKVLIVTAIAVVGIGCRLPGHIDSPDALWGALLAGTDLVGEIPPQRWNADDYYEPVAGVAGRSVSRWGAFLDDPSGFDHRFFGIGEPEAVAMDPQHRLLLEVTWEAAEHSGRDPRRLFGTDAGVFFGLSHQDYMQVTRDAGAMGLAYAFTGTPFSMASGRVAHAMGLTGPAITLDTACSSSLVAVHAARRSLLARECHVAFAGGAMLMFSPTTFASASGLGMLSPTGRCHAFDERADGFVRAEGCGVVMLKLLSDALRDSDRVLAVIRGSAVNQDGRTHNILAPSRAAQIAVIDRALAEAQVDPSSVGMIEAHGTGTPVGDTEEFQSLSTRYGRHSPCALGSLKSNLGHAESAAGVLGLIKATLALAHGVVPRSVHFHQLPAHLQPIETRLFVPTETAPWPSTGADGLRRARPYRPTECPARMPTSCSNKPLTRQLHLVRRKPPEHTISRGCFRFLRPRRRRFAFRPGDLPLGWTRAPAVIAPVTSRGPSPAGAGTGPSGTRSLRQRSTI